MPTPTLSPRTLQALQRQAAKAWPQLLDHPEGYTIGDAGVAPIVAVRAQGWEVIVPGTVMVVRARGQFAAVGDKNGRPWVVPMGDVEDAGGESS
jgi:hypothetical protein